jgi:alpha-1,2-mannosyltransferase
MLRTDRLAATVYALWLGLALGFVVSYLSAVNGLLDTTGNLVGRDFVNMWAGAKAAVGGSLELVFDNALYRASLNQLFGTQLPPHNWSYPPHILPFIAPLAWLPYLSALAVWSLAGLAIYLWRCARSGAGALEFVVLALAPASLVNLITGQNGFFTAAMLWSGLMLLNRKPVLSGIAFGLLTIKPQLGLLLPFILLIDRRWMAIAAACATASFLLALTALLYGPQVFSAYVEQALSHQAYVFTKTEGIFVSMMPTAFMNARLAGFDSSSAWLVQLPFSIAGILFALWLWRRMDDTALKIAAVVTGTFIASPYLFNYDMTIFTPVLIALWARAGTIIDKLILGLVWALPVTCVLTGLAGLPVSFPVLCLFAYWLSRQAQKTPQKSILNARSP